MAAQQKALILLIQDQGIQLLLWQQRVLAVLEDLRNTPEDHEVFMETVNQYPEHGIIVVTDLIDENYRHDHIVHVSGADRDALIKRKLDFTFRSSRYRIGKVEGREKDGRKQDKLLLAAISKPEIIDVWVNPLLAAKRAIQSITSTAWLIRSYVALKKLDKEATLLIISVEPGNNLRQSFFQEGKLLFSRLSNLTSESGTELASEIHNESLQVRQYLERIQFVNYEAPLRILVLSALPAAQLPLAEYSTDANRLEPVDINENPGKAAIDTNEFLLKPAHYILANVLAVTTPVNIYGPPSVTRYHDLLQFGKMVSLAAGVLLLAGLGGNLPTALNIKTKWTQTADLAVRTAPLQENYEKLRTRFPHTEIPPSEMALIVQAYTGLKRQSFSPVTALNMVASALAKTDGVNLTKIEWSLEEIPYAGGVDERGRARKPPASLSGVTPDTKLTGDILKQNTLIKVTITGEAFSLNSFREAQDEVKHFSDALEGYQGVKVNALKLPTDVRTDIDITATVDDREVRSQFILEAIMPINPQATTDKQVAGRP